jgi:hypothetical protein
MRYFINVSGYPAVPGTIRIKKSQGDWQTRMPGNLLPLGSGALTGNYSVEIIDRRLKVAGFFLFYTCEPKDQLAQGLVVFGLIDYNDTNLETKNHSGTSLVGNGSCRRPVRHAAA